MMESGGETKASTLTAARAADDRRLIFRNLANGVSVEQVMQNYRRSEKEVMDIFAYVSLKIRSYRFERGQPFAKCDTIDDARRNAPTVLTTLERLNLASDPKFSKITTLDFDPTPGRVSDGEAKLIEMRLKGPGR